MCCVSKWRGILWQRNTLANKCHQMRQTSRHIFARPSREGYWWKRAEKGFWWKRAENGNQMSSKSGSSCIIAIRANGPNLHLHCTITAIVAELQFAKLLDLASNAEIVQFGETQGMRYRNWGVGCTGRNNLIKLIQVEILRDIFAPIWISGSFVHWITWTPD